MKKVEDCLQEEDNEKNNSQGQVGNGWGWFAQRFPTDAAQNTSDKKQGTETPEEVHEQLLGDILWWRILDVFTVFFHSGLVLLHVETCLEVGVEALCNPVWVFAVVGDIGELDFWVGQVPLLGIVDLMRHGSEKRRKRNTWFDLFVSTAGHGLSQIKRNLGLAFFGALQDCV